MGDVNYPPLVFCVQKPPRITTFDVVRHFKRNLPPGYGKIGHFGTLDPFATGLLLIGVGGAARLNDLAHECLPKTYLAIGKLGVHSDTGDLTEGVQLVDQSDYLKNVISQFDLPFIEKQLKEKFLGTYWQAPHKYSAAKFEGKPLHEWAREGVDIKKDKVERFIHSIKVVKYAFPYLSVRVTVSSGTYVRTLFTEMAQFLGTYGALVSLVRESIGHLTMKDAIVKSKWPVKGTDWDYLSFGRTPTQVLPFEQVILNERDASRFLHGIAPRLETDQKRLWPLDQEGHTLGLIEKTADGFKPVFVFSQYQEQPE